MVAAEIQDGLKCTSPFIAIAGEDEDDDNDADHDTWMIESKTWWWYIGKFVSDSDC